MSYCEQVPTSGEGRATFDLLTHLEAPSGVLPGQVVKRYLLLVPEPQTRARVEAGVLAYDDVKIRCFLLVLNAPSLSARPAEVVMAGEVWAKKGGHYREASFEAGELCNRAHSILNRYSQRRSSPEMVPCLDPLEAYRPAPPPKPSVRKVEAMLLRSDPVILKELADAKIRVDRKAAEAKAAILVESKAAAKKWVADEKRRAAEAAKVRRPTPKLDAVQAALVSGDPDALTKALEKIKGEKVPPGSTTKVRTTGTTTAKPSKPAESRRPHPVPPEMARQIEGKPVRVRRNLGQVLEVGGVPVGRRR
jgi:hypothetical protein